MIDNNSKQISHIEEVQETVKYLSIVKRDIDRNRNILLKLPNGDKFTNINFFVEDLMHGSLYNRMIDDIYKTITYANIFDSYRQTKELMVTLEADLSIYESKNNIIDELINDIQDLRTKLDHTAKTLDDKHNEKQMLKLGLDTSNEKLNEFEALITVLSNYNELKDSKKEVEKELSRIKIDSDKIKVCIESINTISARLIAIDNEIKPLNNQRNELAYSLKMLKSYREELEQHQTNYNTLEVVKKHSTPKTGIQLIFMEIYMGKIISMANELLANFFDGRLSLCKHIINDEEFRIPCYDSESGITNDDISGCSGSEKCMIGMLISYSFLFQSATNYNILRLDEIDGALDSANRLTFINTLNKLMDMLMVQQCIMISHSSEADISGSDVILLSQPGQTVTSIGNANVI
jgi:DNA repair exonuclease SbcCD ATPase subunit